MKNSLLVGLLCSLLLLGCDQKIPYRHAEGKIYGTFYHISYESAEDLQQEVHQEMELVNVSFLSFRGSIGTKVIV